jgi:hypothetical protein
MAAKHGRGDGKSSQKLGCWTVIPRSSLPPNSPIMGTRWTYRKKTNENGTFAVHSLGTTVASLLKDSPKFSKSTTLNPSHPLPP